jgi:NTP pyrophosphatase (non-canonical NTP hydrolase)
MTISKLVQEAHDNARRKGFHKKESEIGTLIALIHSELSEALEAHRTGRFINKDVSPMLLRYADGDEYSMSKAAFETTVKNTFEDELADAVIRIADVCGLLGINLEAHIKAKMRYNHGRPKLHGKRY